MSFTAEEVEEMKALMPLLPLSHLIEETLHTTPVHFGPRGHENLVAQLTVRVAVWCGRNVLPGAR